MALAVGAQPTPTCVWLSDSGPYFLEILPHLKMPLHLHPNNAALKISLHGKGSTAIYVYAHTQHSYVQISCNADCVYVLFSYWASGQELILVYLISLSQAYNNLLNALPC